MSKVELIGFDCKIWGPNLLASWDQSRREQYLLRPEVEVPLSVDVLCWPSVFDSGQGMTLPAQERERMGFTGRPLTEEFVGPFAPYWSSLSALEDEMQKGGIDLNDLRVVQVIKCGIEPDPASMLAPNFSPIGFDVAGLGFCSSVSNCGYYPEEQVDLRRRFGVLLNEYHLFPLCSSAIEYAVVSDDQVPEHAPFSPYLLALR